MKPAIVFDHVWKKFRQGERHDSLRDLIPGFAKKLAKGGLRPELAQEEFWALQDVSFTVEPGKALGIIGSNGAGKSTTLKLLTRILKPTKGRYETHGRVGALIEVAAGFHPDLTGRENVFLQGAIMGMTRTEIAAKFDAIIDFAGIGRFIDTPVKRYSSGMNARLGFSIAAHLNPDVLLIDEVLAVGDMEFQNRCFDRMQEFKRQGTAIAFVSHNLKAVMDLCDETMLLEGGKVKAVGRTSEVVGVYMLNAQETDSTYASMKVDVHATRGGQPISLDRLEPRDRLTLGVALSFSRPVRHTTLGISVWDTRSASYAYESSSELIGCQPISALDGESVSRMFTLDVNLTRGLYQIHVNLYDFDLSKYIVPVHAVSTFSVVEGYTHRGVANLYLTSTTIESAKPQSSELITRG